MGYAEDVIKSLILEEIAQDKVALAIRKRHEVSFKYDSNDGDPRGKLERITVQPVALGTTKAGNPCFRAYQLNGSSESAEKKEGKIPGWRLFILDRVVDNTWRDSGKVFSEPPMYNPNGDSTMAEVFVMADFKGSSARYERGGLKKYNKERHDKAVEKNPYYDFEKQLKKKGQTPDYVMRNIQNTSVDDKTREAQWNQAMAERNKGNAQSISDMARQKDFGDEGQTETTGPMMKNDERNTQQTQNTPAPNYKWAAQNGPKYKNEKNTIDNGSEFEQRAGEGTEDDNGRTMEP